MAIDTTAKYTISGQAFATKKDLVEYVRNILRRYGNGTPLDMFDFSFMADLLRMHPEADEKIGAGVVLFFVADNPVYPGERNRGFHLVRTDGSETDFSFWACIGPIAHRKKVLRALRSAVEADTMSFKVKAFDASLSGWLLCPDTYELLRPATAHVDHRAPKTFDALVQMFLAHEGLGFDDILVTPTEDNTYQNYLVDADLRQRWISYHRDNAELEIVSSRANLSVRKATIGGQAAPSRSSCTGKGSGWCDCAADGEE